MTEQVRYRVDRKLVRQAERICQELGITPTQAVSMFFAQLVRVGGLPFRPSTFPALEEYGVSVQEAEGALAEVAKEKKEGDACGEEEATAGFGEDERQGEEEGKKSEEKEDGESKLVLG